MRRVPRTIPGTTEDILSYLASHGTRDKDIVVPEPLKVSGRKIEKRRGGVLRMTLDLHGLTSEAASQCIRQTIETCRRHGVRELLIIHGRGCHSGVNEGPVLKNMVGGMLENELALGVRDFRTGLPREGGEGATLVFLS